MKQFTDADGKALFKIINKELEDGLKITYANKIGME